MCTRLAHEAPTFMQSNDPHVSNVMMASQTRAAGTKLVCKTTPCSVRCPSRMPTRWQQPSVCKEIDFQLIAPWQGKGKRNNAPWQSKEKERQLPSAKKKNRSDCMRSKETIKPRKDIEPKEDVLSPHLLQVKLHERYEIARAVRDECVCPCPSP